MRRQALPTVVIAALTFAVLALSVLPVAGHARKGTLSVSEAAAQVLVPEVWMGADADQRARWRDVMRWVERLGVGGVHVFGDDADAAGKWIAHLRKRSRRGLLVTADLEGGPGYILKGGTRVPRAMALAATGDVGSAATAARITAVEARELGVTVNLYPVADVNNNPANPIIQVRAFGDEPDLVARFVRAYVDGAQKGGVLACAKHFPGHGDTRVDSHKALPVIERTRAQLRRTELVPFRAAIDAGVAAVMTGHLAVPALDDTPRLPATLSRPITTELLRRELGFDGLVITDALKMQGVRERFSPGETCVRALVAGADILLFPADVDACHAAIVRAVESGRLPRARLDDAAARVQAARRRAARAPRVNLRLPNRRRLAADLFRSAVTLAQDPFGDVPVRSAEPFLIALHDGDEGAGATLASVLNGARLPVGPRASPRALEDALAAARTADAIVLGVFARDAVGAGRNAFTEGQRELARAVQTLGKPVVVASFGNPYALSSLPRIKRALVIAWESHALAERAVGRAIRGGIGVSGRAPIAIPGVIPRGAGIERRAAGARRRGRAP